MTCNPVEGHVQPIPVLEAHRRDARLARPFAHLRQLDEAIAVGERQRPQQDGVNGGEDRGVCPDAKRQRQHDCHREPRCAGERADGVARISHRGVHRPGDIDVPRPLALNDRIAKLKPCASFRLFGADTLGSQLVRSFGKMKRDLALDVPFDPPRTKRIQ